MSLPDHLADLESRIRARFDAAVEELRRQYEARLRQASEQMLATLGEVRGAAADPLAGLDTSDLDHAARAAGRADAVAELVAAARTIDRADTQAAVLDALLGAARGFAARAGMLLVREDAVRGWGSRGFDGDPFAGRELGWDDDLLAPLAAGRGMVTLDGAAAGRLAERLGIATPPDRAVLVPLVLRDRVAAALYADATGPAPLEPGALQLLSAAAAAHIELQALSERQFTPTLWTDAEAPGAGLPLWTAAEAPASEPKAAAPAPEPVAAAAPAAAMPEPPVAPSEAPAEPAPAWTPEAEPEPSFAAEPEAPPAPFVPAAAEPPSALDEAIALDVAPVEPGIEPSAADFWTGAESAQPADEAGFEIEAEPPAEPPPTPAPAAAEPPLGDATVRIPVFRSEPAAAPTPPPPEAPPASAELPWYRPASPPPAPTAADEDTTTLGQRTEPAPLPTQAVPPPPAPRLQPEEEANERTAVRAARTTEVAPPADVRGPGLAFAAGRSARVSGDNALHEEAKRLARLLVSEIKLYNEEQVIEGRRNRDLYVRLKEDIDRSRQIYEERVHESVRQGSDYFHQELVRSLAGGDARALGM